MKDIRNSSLQKSVSVLPEYPVWFEIILGIVFGILNYLMNPLLGPVKVHTTLFFDTIFIVTAGFCGWISGFFSVVVHHACIMLIQHEGWIGRLFGICSLSAVIIIRLFYRKKEKISILSLLVVYLVIMLTISLEGAIIVTFAYNKFDYIETTNLKYITSFFMHQQIPMIFSSFLSRIPVNLADKAICTFTGWGIFIGCRKLFRKMEKDTVNL